MSIVVRFRVRAAVAQGASRGATEADAVESFRTPDVMPTIRAAMGITQTSPTAGRVHLLDR